jgi:hypothetical protein
MVRDNYPSLTHPATQELRHFSMRLRLIFLLIVTASPLFAQQVRVLLNIPKVTSLRVAAASPEVQVIDASTTNRLLLRVHRPVSSSVIVPLVVRSNTAYQLSVSGPESVQFRVVAVKPFAGTEHLMPGAESVHITGPIGTSVLPVTILEGPRISNGGNDTTPTNALMIELEVTSLDANAEVTVLMKSMPD